MILHCRNLYISDWWYCTYSSTFCVLTSVNQSTDSSAPLVVLAAPPQTWGWSTSDRLHTCLILKSIFMVSVHFYTTGWRGSQKSLHWKARCIRFPTSNYECIYSERNVTQRSKDKKRAQEKITLSLRDWAWLKRSDFFSQLKQKFCFQSPR